MPNHEDNSPILIPAWVYKVIVAAAMAFGAWMLSINVQLATLNTRMEAITERMKDIKTIEAALAKHMADPDIHHAGINKLAREVEALRRRVDRLEDRK